MVATSWRLFALAPRSALPLWSLATATSLALDRGATQHLLAVAHPDVEGGRLGRAVAVAVAGWAVDCVVQALWAQLAWQALSGRETGLMALWRRLRGAWAGVGLLVAYASLSVAAVGWPQLHRALRSAPQPAPLAAAAAALALCLGWLALRTSLGVPAAAAEQRGGRAAWVASWRLTGGRLGTLMLLLPAGSACALAVSLAGGALPEVWAGQATCIAALSAGVQSAFGGLPGTLYWAWQRGGRSKE